MKKSGVVPVFDKGVLHPDTRKISERTHETRESVC
jgi:hypothetical protein